jgi:hypothetical protein
VLSILSWSDDGNGKCLVEYWQCPRMLASLSSTARSRSSQTRILAKKNMKFKQVSAWALEKSEPFPADFATAV